MTLDDAPDDAPVEEPTPDLPELLEPSDLLAASARSIALSELTEQAAPDPAPADSPAQIAADLAALQLRLNALGIADATASITTTKGLR